MGFENIDELIDAIKRVMIGEGEDINLQDVENFLVDLIERNRELTEKNRDPFVSEYLRYEKEALEKLLLTWRRYVMALLIKKENKVRLSSGERIEKVLKVMNSYLQVDGKTGILGIVKKEVPPFRGSDGVEYGPFSPGDIVLINRRDYTRLVERGLIDEVVFDI
jgi:hypothetical protein